MEPIFITKSNGEREEFNPDKLLASLRRAKADDALAEKILNHIKMELRDGMSTKEIYKHAFDALHREHRPVALRYSIRKAVMELGPTGFPFETFVSKIFEAKGFETKTDQELLGSCVPHEIDVVAWNENKLIVVEAKFHNEIGIKSDLKVVLYIKERFDDLENNVFNYGRERKIDESWLVTNTKFSTQAIHFAECKNMKLIGWNYPDKGSLQDLIEEEGLHPITCLHSISMVEKRSLMSYGIVLCREALENPDIAAQAGIHPEKIKRMMEEINLIQA